MTLLRFTRGHFSLWRHDSMETVLTMYTWPCAYMYMLVCACVSVSMCLCYTCAFIHARPYVCTRGARTRQRIALPCPFGWIPIGSNECFDGLGCFSNDPPFLSLHRPLSLLPQSPEQIHPTFTLFTRQAPSVGHVLQTGSTSGLATSTFSASRPTKFIVHGFIDNGGTDWMAVSMAYWRNRGDFNGFIFSKPLTLLDMSKIHTKRETD